MNADRTDPRVGDEVVVTCTAGWGSHLRIEEIIPTMFDGECWPRYRMDNGLTLREGSFTVLRRC